MRAIFNCERLIFLGIAIEKKKKNVLRYDKKIWGDVEVVSRTNVYRVSSAQFLGARSRQEDTVSVSPNEVYGQRGLLMVLADGMGGMANGHLFSQLVCEEMQRCFCTMELLPDMQQTLVQCFEAVQQRAVAMNRDAEDEGGATMVAVLIRDEKCTFLSVGDSRLALIRNGGLIWLNRPQVMSTRLDENVALGYLRQEDVQGSALRDAVTGYVGSSAVFAADACTAPFELIPGDRLALMSDGVTGTLNDKELLMYLMTPSDVTVSEVVQAVQRKKRPEQDNSSILLAVVE